jgi:hypothetical protein
MKVVPGFDAYAADEDGTIYTQYENGTGNLSGEWRVLKPVPQRSGYQHVTLYRDGVGHQLGVHAVILMTFVGPCPEGEEGCHENGKPWENHLGNLRWDTRKNNHADKIKHGTSQRGQKNGNSKLDDEDAEAMLAIYREDGKTSEEVGAIFGVSGSLVRKMNRGRVRSCV